MWIALGLTAAALALAVWRLGAYRHQLLDLARTLEETPPESNLRLRVTMSGAAARRLCLALNERLEAGRRLRQQTLQDERQLRNTMACISHDIRTPLAGAMGYLQLLAGASPAQQAAYLQIIQRRLEELGALLDELFLYTRLLDGDAPAPDCADTPALPPLYEALAELYPQLQAAGIQPQLHFAEEGLRLWANGPALGRVYRNLILNAIRHGGGGLVIWPWAQGLCFANPLGPGPRPDPARLFERFYRADTTRAQGGSGLGLAIVQELMHQMGGQVAARLVTGAAVERSAQEGTAADAAEDLAWDAGKAPAVGAGKAPAVGAATKEEALSPAPAAKTVATQPAATAQPPMVAEGAVRPATATGAAASDTPAAGVASTYLVVQLTFACQAKAAV